MSSSGGGFTTLGSDGAAIAGEVTSCTTAARCGVMTDGVSFRRVVLMATDVGSVEVTVFLVVCMRVSSFVDGLDFVACGFDSGCFNGYLRAVWTEGAWRGRMPRRVAFMKVIPEVASPGVASTRSMSIFCKWS
jgi:hypothetical protein